MNDDALLAAIGERITSLSPELVDVRRDLHAHPELSREETRTTELLARRLDAAGVALRRLPGTGLLADVGAPEPVFRVGLRADMDALPVRERSGVEFASTTPGVCHACGHDVHTAALLGALLALKDVEPALVRRGIAVRGIFQAAEEVIPGGAHEAISAGAVDGLDAVFAVHCDPSLDVGEVGLREGPLTAACDHVTVTVHGRGGHTSRPQLTEDLVYALAKVVTDVPAALSRRLDPRTGAALVWGRIEGGRASNVIPSSGECQGTLRMLDAQAWLGVGPLLEEIVHGVVQPYGVQAKIERVKGVPPVVNTTDGIEAFRLAALSSGMHPVPTAQSLGGEDFSWYLAHTAGAMARLGTRTHGGPTFDLHQGDLVVDEDSVCLGARLLASVAVVRALEADRPHPVDEA
jgi:amidohydrolase